MKALLSPTENDLSKALGDSAITSSLPEERGADVLLFTKQGVIGIQRKKVPHDFISSIEDGRMARSTTLLQSTCPFRLLLCEGRFRYYPDGRLDLGPRVPSHYTIKHLRGMLFDIRFVKNVEVDYTDDIRDTAYYIRSLGDFFNAEKHLGLFRRPGAKGTWGAPTSEDIDLWLLQSFQGIGVTLAGNIVEQFGGKVPLQWSCSLAELRSVPGLGKKRAEALWGALGHGTAEAEGSGLSRLEEIRKRLTG